MCLLNKKLQTAYFEEYSMKSSKLLFSIGLTQLYRSLLKLASIHGKALDGALYPQRRREVFTYITVKLCSNCTGKDQEKAQSEKDSHSKKPN